MSQRVLNQVIIGATHGDAITDQALLLQRWLRERGLQSEIYAEVIAPDMQGEARYFDQYRPAPGEKRLIYHQSIGSAVTGRLLEMPLRLLLIYHNVTPPEFFAATDPVLARQLRNGREELKLLPGHTGLALADSPYNEAELKELGFGPTGVLPIMLDEANYNLPLNAALQAELAGLGPKLLFVGRVAPNKRQEDLVKLLHFYRQIEPRACLALVGQPWLASYQIWLVELARTLGVLDAVRLVGPASQADLVTYYRSCDLYVSMSEHEGFGKPLIESMHLGLPVLAYASTAVPGTMGGTGALFHHKHYPALAEAVDLLVRDAALRGRMIARQRAHAAQFLQGAVRQRWETWLDDVLGGAA